MHRPPDFHFIQCDVKDLAIEHPYDIVTSFMSMVMLDLDIAMKNISAALSEGGLFVMLEPYWWYPYLFFGVAGEFPYAFQRLDEIDLERYVDLHHAEDKEMIKSRLNTFKNKWTINDYVRWADKHGLDLIGERRYIQTENRGVFRSVISPQFLNQYSDTRLNDVLRDINYFRPDVQYVDLLTSYVLLVFRKHRRKETGAALVCTDGLLNSA